MRVLVPVAVVALMSGCFVKSQSVRRELLAPLPPLPITMFDRDHAAQARLNFQVHPTGLQNTTNDTGLMVPIYQGDLGLMIRVGRRYAMGGAFEFAPADHARAAQRFSSPMPEEGSFGFRLAGHGLLYDGEVFGLDSTAQVSLHAMPSATFVVAPLDSQGTLLGSGPTAIPGVALALFPRVTTRVGTFFAGLSASTNADIAPNGVSTPAFSAFEDHGHVSSEIVCLAGAGYVYSHAASGLGVQAQVWMPLTRAPVGYSLMFSLAVTMGVGPAPHPWVREVDDEPVGPPQPPAPTVEPSML